MKKTLVTLLTAALVIATVAPVKANAYTPENDKEELLYSVSESVFYEFEENSIGETVTGNDIELVPDSKLEELYETVWQIADERSDEIEAELEKDYEITWFEYTVYDPDVYETLNEYDELVVVAEYTIEYEVWGTALETIETPVEPTYEEPEAIEEVEEIEAVEVIEETVEEAATVDVTEEVETVEVVDNYTFPVYFTNELVTK